MNWKNKRVLVTGGAGVIGRELINKLITLQAQVLCIDRKPKPVDMLSALTYCKKDIVDMDITAITDFDPEIIFHLAASFERTEETPEFWDINFRDNIIVSHRIIDITRHLENLEKFIFASSYLIYSSSLYMFDKPAESAYILCEEDLLETRNLTGAAKYYAEKELEFMNDTHGKFTTISARIFRVYGCGSRDVVSRWIRMALDNKELIVFQKENIFDYIYAGDVAISLIEVSEKINKNEIINLGSGRGYRIEEVIQDIMAQIPNAKIKEIGGKGRFEASCANMSKFLKLAGQQKPINLEAGIQKIIAYEKNNSKKHTYA